MSTRDQLESYLKEIEKRLPVLRPGFAGGASSERPRDALGVGFTLACEGECDRSPDTASTTGDDGNLAGNDA